MVGRVPVKPETKQKETRWERKKKRVGWFPVKPGPEQIEQEIAEKRVKVFSEQEITEKRVKVFFPSRKLRKSE